MEFTETQILTWLQSAFWPMVRIGGVLMTAPVFGDGFSSPLVRLMLMLALTLILAPLLPAAVPLPMFSAEWWLRGGEELAVGLMLGFILKIALEAVVMGGELIGNSMGIGFARVADPVRGADAPVVGEFLQVTAVLVFLSVGGHLRLIEALADSFRHAPVGGELLGANVLYTVFGFAGRIFEGAMSVALPTVAALLLVNLAFGVMSRSAPTLNGLSVGFPLSLIAGLFLMQINLPQLGSVLEIQLDAAWALIASLVGVPH